MLLAVLESRNLLFSEAAQAVYELDDFSAYVWRSMQAGLGQSDIAREMAEAGAEPVESAGTIQSAILKLRDLQASDTAERKRRSPPAEPLTCMKLCIAGVSVQLSLADALRAEIEDVFGPYVCESSKSHAQLSARLVGETVELLLPGQPGTTCERAEFVPLLKAFLIDCVLEFATHEVALHAAALVAEGKALLLLGSPGSGKTTLATALARRGFKVAADDVVLLDGTGRVTGLPLPFTVKETAWTMLSPEWPGLAEQPAYRRPDGIQVRYLQHDLWADPGPLPVRRVVLLNRQSSACASLDEVSAVPALEALIAEGHSRDERLSEAGFAALATALGDARCFRLTYSDRVEAAQLVTSLAS